MFNRFLKSFGSRPDVAMTRTQESFILWNAERLGISAEESRRRYQRSWNAIQGGHGGRAYRRFNDLAYEFLQVLFDDSEGEVFESYRMHAPMHFLRMLSYEDPVWSDDDPIVLAQRGRSAVTILDFGCGLAHRSRALALDLRDRGVTANLALADIVTLRKGFLLWLGERSGISTTFLDCSAAAPIPTLPPCDVCIATEFFEHVYDPVKYFDHIDAALRPGGMLLTGASDHHAEYMHVSPNLAALRERIRERAYQSLQPNVLFQKPA